MYALSTKAQNVRQITEGSGDREVCLVSGGIDSTILLQLLSRRNKVIGIFFDYGQANLEPTLKAARYYSNEFNTELKVIKVPFDWSKASVIGNQFIDEKITDKNVYKKDVKKLSWVPARNLIFLLIAGGIASENNIGRVWASFQFDECEWQKYKQLKHKWEFGGADLTPAFIDQTNEIAKYCYKTEVKFIAPYIDNEMDCNDIVELADFDLSHTYSCRYYKDGGPCGKCEQCIIRERRLKC